MADDPVTMGQVLKHHHARGVVAKIDALKIGCAQCDRGSATIVDGALVWRVKHNGEMHVNVISLAQLKKLLEFVSDASMIVPEQGA